jgi:hypothetical protein
MAGDFAQTGIDWKGRGYWGCPELPPAAPPGSDLATDPWLLWNVAFQQAKRGVFDRIPELIDVRRRDLHPILSRLCVTLLGDAGTTSCFAALHGYLSTGVDYEMTIDFAGALCLRGLLADAPVLLRAFVSLADIKDAAIIPVYLSDLLGGLPSDPARFVSVNEYCDVVMARYRQLVEELGTERIFVLEGKAYGVVPLARSILERLREPHFRPVLRRRFEASTGIDCTNFYRDHTLQPLAAAAIVEQFLESPAAKEYETGVRYFFGQRIPE